MVAVRMVAVDTSIVVVHMFINQHILLFYLLYIVYVMDSVGEDV